MPCRSDHLEPSSRERESVRVLEFLREVRGQDFDHDRPHAGLYGDPDNLDRDTAELCGRLKTMGAPEIRDHLSLELQLWWQRHQAVDAAREHREQVERERREARAEALSKLSADERRALGV